MEGVLGVGLEEVHLNSVYILSPRTPSWPQMSTGSGKCSLAVFTGRRGNGGQLVTLSQGNCAIYPVNMPGDLAMGIREERSFPVDRFWKGQRAEMDSKIL